MPVAHSVLNVKALVGTFNQKKALGGAFSVIVKTSRTFVSSSSLNAYERLSMHGNWQCSFHIRFQFQVLLGVLNI